MYCNMSITTEETMFSTSGSSSSSSATDKDMRVTKRNGSVEIVSFDKILNRIKNIGMESNININYTSLVVKVIDQLYDLISTTKIDELSAEQCASMASIHPDYNVLAGRIIISNHHKDTSSIFSDVMHELYSNTDIHGSPTPMISRQLYETVQLHSEELNALCDYSRDYLIDYFGFKTLERSYLMQVNRKVVERPQHMWLRVAMGIHGTNMEKIKETYHLMSQKYFTHATPTLFNAGTNHPQLSSCYLIAMENDSIEGIYNTLKDCALISKWAGGIGMHIHNIRASGSRIRGTNGQSNGIVPMLKVFNNTAKYVDQCLHPSTIIYTQHGPKQIQHVAANETQIYGLNGELETIGNVLEHSYYGDMLQIQSAHSHLPLQITPEHPVYVLPKDRNECEWMEAGKLMKGDKIAYSIPQHSVDVESIREDDCFMYGIILLYGFINKNNEYCTLKFNSVNEVFTNFIIEYFEKNTIDYKVLRDKNKIEFIWKGSIHSPFRYYYFYNEQGRRRLHHKWLNLPIHKSMNIIKCFTIEPTANQPNMEYILYNETNYELLNALKFLLLKMGVLAGITTYEKTLLNTPYNTSCIVPDTNEQSYVLSIPKTSEICKLLGINTLSTNRPFTFEWHSHLLLSPITQITKTTYSGILFDLQMTNEHNYLLDNGIVHNGGGKRNGSFAIYLEPWHADIELFLQMRKNHGDEELKARDLFYALWMPDLFMERVKAGGKWTLMCPDECPGLADVYAEDFVKLYESYESKGKGRKTLNARDLWFQILDAQMETGTPYILYKDAVNRKSNQKNLGVIKSSNLCCEITEYSDSNETAVCNLASIALPSFVKSSSNVDGAVNHTFDYDELHRITRVVTYNLNRIIDINYYPTAKTELSNRKHRPIGIGVQGLADVFMQLNLPFSSKEAKEINRLIFETIYHAALEESCELSIREGHYDTFVGSPASRGILQFDMWNINVSNSRYNWEELRAKIMTNGLRNSLLVAPMPTASTSQILGYNECIEPITSNIYSRRTLAGEFIIANKYMMKDLLDLGLWDEKIKNNIIANNGSIQHIESIPEEIRNKYRTVWELPMRDLIDMAADRGAYICQSQSLNLWLEDPNYNNLTSMHFYGWSKGLKTGIYYLRRRAAHKAQQFTIEVEKKETTTSHYIEDEVCEMCSA
jgi:ribonucleoside-diphosphate reductase alpha subunit